MVSAGGLLHTEAARVQPCSPFAPAHDLYNRLINRLEPDPEQFWNEAESLVEKAHRALIIDDSTLDKRHARHIGLVTRHWSGEHKKVIRGINLTTLSRNDGGREIPVDYRIFSMADGLTKHDHFWEVMLMAKGRGFSPTTSCSTAGTPAWRTSSGPGATAGCGSRGYGATGWSAARDW
jgi:putative transposase